MVSAISDFKGNKVITLKENEEDQYGFSFGIRKGKLILQHLKEIKEFVKEE